MAKTPATPAPQPAPPPLARVFHTPPRLPIPQPVIDLPDAVQGAGASDGAHVSTPQAVSGTRRDAHTRYALEFSHGPVIEVVGDGIVGRTPRRDGGHTHIVTVPDGHKLLSRNHFEFGLTIDNQLWVTDCGSGNGTYLGRGATQVALVPGERVAVTSGTVIRFGDEHATVR